MKFAKEHTCHHSLLFSSKFSASYKRLTLANHTWKKCCAREVTLTLLMFIPGTDGPTDQAKSWRSWAQHKGWSGAQAAYPHLQDIQGPGRRPHRPAICGGCCYKRYLIIIQPIYTHDLLVCAIFHTILCAYLNLNVIMQLELKQ